MEEYEINKFNSQNTKLVSLNYFQSRLSSLNSPINDLIGLTIGVILLWYGGSQVLEGVNQLTRDDFLRFILLLFATMQHIRKLGGVNSTIQSAIASGERVFHILDTENSIFPSFIAVVISNNLFIGIAIDPISSSFVFIFIDIDV